ncbi:hypothetical protein HDU77_001324 [Chytriomyces hyalinus]|nr:hypothetical protein HDU77_001324 [Chytriomyces hyalinus]
MDKWLGEFRDKSIPQVLLFFYSKLGIASFTSLSDFKACRVSVFKDLKGSPFHVSSSISDFLDYIKDSDLISPSHAWQVKIANSLVSTRLSALRTALKKSFQLQQLAKILFDLATVVVAVYAADPRAFPTPTEIRDREIMTVCLPFPEKDFWDYMTVLVGQFKGMSEAESTEYQSSLNEFLAENSVSHADASNTAPESGTSATTEEVNENDQVGLEADDFAPLSN